jgi:hypothetical protein
VRLVARRRRRLGPRILREYERAVVLPPRRLVGAKGPGVVLPRPLVDRMVRGPICAPSPSRSSPQDVITRDNVPAKVNAVAYFRVVDPSSRSSRSSATAPRPRRSRRRRCARCSARPTSTRSWPSASSLNESLQQIIDEQTDPWGVKVTTVEIKDVGIPQGMQRAMARQAEAERERRAKVINAEGEFQASERLFDAAEVMSGNPPRCSCATCRRCWRSGPTRTRRSSSRCPSTSSSRSCSPSRTAPRGATAPRARSVARGPEHARARRAEDELQLPDPDAAAISRRGEEDDSTG